MNSYQEALTTMRASVLECMRKYETVWNTNPGLVQIVGNLQQNENQMNEALSKQNISIPGITKEKAKFRTGLNITAHEITGVICAYASSISNKEVFGQFNLPLTTVQRIRDTEFPSLVNDIEQYITAHAQELEPFGLTPQLTDRFNIEKAGYLAYMVRPVEAKAAKIEATKRIKTLLAEMRDILKNHLDKAMLIYRTLNPELFIEYMAARNIYNNPTSPMSLKGQVIDAVTAQPVNRVAVTILPAGFIKYTGIKGIYRFLGIKPGKYTVRFEKLGYKTTEHRIIIHEQATATLDIALSPEPEEAPGT